MKVFINPFYSAPDQGDGGIRRVVEAQQRYLPDLGIQIASSPEDADLIANHGASLVERPGVPMVNHNHGLMWADYGFGQWGDDINKHVIECMVRANAITAPSKWVANAITRGMLARPTVIYHGVDADAWAHNEQSLGYVLWNKARADQVSDPRDMQDVAALLPNVRFLSTFGQQTSNVYVCGAMAYEAMRLVVQRAGVYLATARETFGIGTLEALAAGVPVAGWRYGGQEEIIIEGETGYLAEWGDYEGLAQAITRCLADRDRLSRNCVQDARARWGWQDKIGQYAELYQQTLAAYHEPRPKVSVVVTCHNLDRYLNDAVDSVLNQTMRDWELLIVDDDSTDRTGELSKALEKYDKRIRYEPTPRNLKLSGARNYGWQRATGRYLLFLDADDMLAHNALDSLSSALDQHTDIHIAFGHLDTISDDGSGQRRNPWPGPAFDYYGQIAHLNQLPYCSMMRREVLERSGGYRARDWRAEDASLWTRLTSFGFRAAKVTDETCLIYRIRPDSKGATERREHTDIDGDWTAWYPWRLAGDAASGMQALNAGAKPNPQIVPFGAQGTPPAPLRAWPVHHHQHPLVSVIVPVGPGHARYLVDALDSLVAQTFTFWEAVVVDDTNAIDLVDMSAAVQGHPFVRITITEGARGAGAARNAGIAEARAPLVLFLDADDVLVPRALEEMVRAYIESGGQYVYSDWLSLEDDARIDGRMVAHEVEDYDQRAMLQGLRHAVTALVPVEWVRSVGGFDEKLAVFEDWDLYCKLAIMGYCGVRCPEPLLIYRRTAGTRTRAALKPRGKGHGETQYLASPPAYTELGEAAALAIADRYAAWRGGEEQIMGCCGGNAKTVAQASDALAEMMGFATGAPLELPAQGVTSVRMEFIGDEWGEQSYVGDKSGRVYRAGRDPNARFHDVDPRDVERLVALGKFRVVEAAALVNTAEPLPAGVVVEAPRRRRGR